MNTKRENVLLKIFLAAALFLSTALFGITQGFPTARAAGDFTVSGMSYHGKVNEMYEFYITVSGYKPTSNSWSKYMKETDSSINVPDKIEINGKTVTALNTDYRTAAAEWNFNMFPANSGGYYQKMPILIKGSGGANSIVLYIHETLYNALVAESGKVRVQARSGLVAEGNTLSEDSSLYEVVNENGVPNSVKIAPQTADVTENTTVSGWIHQDSELRVFNVNFGTGIMPSGIGYGVIDNAAYKYIAEYITVNGKTVKAINEETDTSGYSFNVYPSSSMNVFKVPVIVFVNGDNIEVKIHDTYYATLTEDLTVSVLEGLVIVNGNTEYSVTENVTYTRKHGEWRTDWQTADVTENVNVNDWTEINGIKAFNIYLGEGVLPSGIDYDAIDKENYKYITEYITINGKTVKEINENTDTTGWIFGMFPSDSNDKYKLPVIIYINTQKIEVRVHDNYYASLEGHLTISVLEGLVIVNGETENVVSETVSYIRKSNQWFDLNYEYTVNYYVNGEIYATEKYKLTDAIEMKAAPDTETGYEFSGWDKQITKISDGDEDINGYITAIKYTITYNLNNGENSPVNPIRYTIESDKIVLQDAEKEGYTFDGWFDDDGNKIEEIPAGSYGDIVLNAKYTNIMGGGCVSGISGGFIGAIIMLLCAVAVMKIRFVNRSANK